MTQAAIRRDACEPEERAKENPVLSGLLEEFGADSFRQQTTADGIPTLWVDAGRIIEVLGFLKRDFPMLYDLTAVDERNREHRDGLPAADFTVVYQLLSTQQDRDIRLKVALEGETPALPTAVALWPAANWYEREVWDLFGISFSGHPNLRRILTPPTWEGHPLRKDYPLGYEEVQFSFNYEEIDAKKPYAKD